MEKASILIVPYVVSHSPNALDIRPSLTGVPEAFILSEGLDAIYVGELHHIRFANASFYEGDVECHHGVDEIRVNWKGMRLK